MCLYEIMSYDNHRVGSKQLNFYNSKFIALLIYNLFNVFYKVIELPVKHPELFESLGIDQPKVRMMHFDWPYLTRSSAT